MARFPDLASMPTAGREGRSVLLPGRLLKPGSFAWAAYVAPPTCRFRISVFRKAACS